MPPRSIKEKIREALLAIKLEHELGKDQILAKYLNTVYFGHGAYGAEAAAQTYFGIQAQSSSTVSQSAVLAAVLHAPSLYDPIKSAYDNKFRRDYTLDQMAKYGYITAERGRRAEGRRSAAASRRPSSERAGPRSTSPAGSEYFVDYTRQRLFDEVRQRQGLRRWPADHDDARPGHAARPPRRPSRPTCPTHRVRTPTRRS